MCNVISCVVWMRVFAMTSAFSWQNSVSFCSASFCTLRKSLHFLTKMQSVQNCTVVLVTQSCLTLCDPTDGPHQAPLSTEFSRQGYWSGLPFPSPGDLPDPGIEPGSPALQADSLPSEPLGKPKIALALVWTAVFHMFLSFNAHSQLPGDHLLLPVPSVRERHGIK